MLSCFSRVWRCDPMDCVAHQAPLFMGILQARILEWVAIPSSRIPDPGIEPVFPASSALQMDSLLGKGFPLGKPFKSPQTAANESTLYNYWSPPIVLEPCSRTREASAMRSPCTERKDNSHSLKLEKAYTQQLRSSTTKKKKKKPNIPETNKNPKTHGMWS